MRRMFGNGRYANVTATLALVIALGGTSWAAVNLPARSVGSKQLKNGAVTNSKLRPNAVTSGKVKNGSLRAQDFKAGQLPAGPPGPAGATNVVRRTAASPAAAAGGISAITVPCAAGERALTGGVQSDRDPLNIFTLTESFPITVQSPAGDVPVGWYVEARNTAGASAQFLGFVVCARP